MLRKFLLLISTLLFTSIIIAAPAFEIAQSIPKETILGVKNIRQTQTVWLDMIKQAKKTIDVGAFYFVSKPHEGMAPVIHAFKNAANRGVKIRIIIGSLFEKESLKTLKPLEHKNNIQICIMPMKKLTNGIMHAKYFIVDGHDTFIGSPNFDWRALDQIHEIGVRINNRQFAQTIEQIFLLDWQLCNTQSLEQAKKIVGAFKVKYPVTRLNPIRIQSHHETLTIYPAFNPEVLLPQGLNWEETELLYLIGQAKHRILIQVMQYSPLIESSNQYWSRLNDALIKAASRGVNVKLIFANWSLVKNNIPYLQSLALIPNIELKISTIPPYSKGFIPFARVEHCKYMVIDNNISWIETGNWTWLYFHAARNIAVIIKGNYPNETLSQIFFKDWNGPYTKMMNPVGHYSEPKMA